MIQDPHHNKAAVIHTVLTALSYTLYLCLANFLASPTRWMKSFKEFSWSW